MLAVRRERPQIIVSTFVGGITDGHGQHQVSGEIAQEVFKAAADPKVFPEQLQATASQPWQPLAVYSMVPFAPVTEKGMFDYATGKWAPAKFHNYATGRVDHRRTVDRCKASCRHTRSIARPQLYADRTRGMGRTEISKRRRQSDAQRARDSQLSPSGQ